MLPAFFQAFDHFPMIFSKRQILGSDVPVARFQFMDKTAFPTLTTSK